MATKQVEYASAASEEEEEVIIIEEYQSPDSDNYEEVSIDEQDQSGCSSSSRPTSERRKEYRKTADMKESAGQRKARLARDLAAKHKRLAEETPEQRQLRLQRKKEINRRYYDRETPERRNIRLSRKAERDRRNRLDSQLQSFHPDILASVGIEISSYAEGCVEMRVPWPVSANETEEEKRERYDCQEEVINQLKSQETPEMTQYRLSVIKTSHTVDRKESAEKRARRLKRAREQTRIRRQNETPDKRVKRLERQRIRTQNNRLAKEVQGGESQIITKREDDDDDDEDEDENGDSLNELIEDEGDDE